MFKSKEYDEYMYPILGYDKYSISRTGRVGKSLRVPGNNDRYQEYKYIKLEEASGQIYVRITSNEGKENKLSVARLNAISIYGDLPFKIGFIDGNKLNINGDNLFFRYDNIEIISVFDKSVNETYNVMKITGNNQYELFREIPESYFNYNHRYWANRNGAIFDYKLKRFLRRSTDDHGYYKCKLYGETSNDTITAKPHIIVYLTWHLHESLDGFTIDHVDGRRHNNKLDNLEKVSLAENIRRAHDRNISESKIIRAKWSIEEVHKICKMLEAHASYNEVAEAFGVDHTDKTSKDYKSIVNICKAIMDKRVFKDISCNYVIENSTIDNKWQKGWTPPQIFDKEVVRQLCEDFVKGMTPGEAAIKYEGKITKGTIYNIKIGKQYRDVAETVPGMIDVINSKLREYCTAEEAEDIGRLISEGKSYKEIAEYFNIPPTKKDRKYCRLCSRIRKVIDGRLFPEIKEKYNLERIYIPQGNAIKKS